MRIDVFGGWSVEHDGAPVEVTGDRQRGLLFRLALDPGTVVGYRALSEDLWPDDPPENPKASLQSLVTRLRQQLPAGLLESAPGGYRLAIRRDDVDAIRFQDAVAAASSGAPESVADLASAALALWTGEPWTPGEGYDWFERALRDDRATAVRLGGTAGTTLVTPESAIPSPLTALIGRTEEIAAVSAAVHRSRLTTILGPGGAGKTRIAVEVARRTPGALLVELAPVGADEVWAALIGVLGRDLRTADGQSAATSPRERAVTALAGRDAVLVLDNCEHLIDAVAAVAHELLRALPRLRVLATSREPLGVEGEAFVPLGPLTDADAERLFAERVLAARGTALTDAEQPAAARVRARLDGLPLALELAAARTRTLTLDELDAGLDDRFALLAAGPRSALPRHQTLRALIDWSWDLLGDAERRMLTAVAIYPGGIAAADAAAAARAHGGTVAELDALVDKSLLQRASGRYRALETIREYGLERLDEAGSLETERRIQLARLAEAAAERDATIRGAGVLDAIAWFDAEEDNISAALRFGVDHESPDAVRLAAATAWYWVIRDRNDDAMTWLTATAPLAAARQTDEELLVHAVGVLSQVFGGLPQQAGSDEDEPHARSGGRPFLDEVGKTYLHELVDAVKGRQHDLLQVIPVLMVAFETAMEQGNWPVSIDIPAEAAESLGDWPRGMVTVMRAAMAHNSGSVAELGEASSEAVALFERNGDQWGLALSKQMRAEWLILDGQLELALQLNDESTGMMRRITSAWDLQQQQGSSIGILMRLGRVDEARERAEQQLAAALLTGSSRVIVQAEAGIAMVHLALGDADAAEPHLVGLRAAIAEWPDVPLQLSAMADAADAAYARLRGDLDAAEELLRRAADAAVASGDHPIMAMVALGVGALALERGEHGDARRALELAVVMRGAPDPHDPSEARLREALGLTQKSPAAAIEGGTGLDRDGAAEALSQILRR